MSAGFDAIRPDTDELEALLRQKDGEPTIINSPPMRTSSGNPMSEGHDMSLIAGKHNAPLPDRTLNPADR